MLIPANGSDIIAHHDLAPWNLVIGDPHWVFIDWDNAAPGTRLWDLAYALHGFVPLSADPRWNWVDAGHRMRVFVDAYGLDESERRELIALLAPRNRAMSTFLRAQAAAGTQPWTWLWQEGHGEVRAADADYIEQRRREWERALLDCPLRHCCSSVGQEFGCGSRHVARWRSTTRRSKGTHLPPEQEHKRVIDASGTIEIAEKTVHRIGFGTLWFAGPVAWGEPEDRDSLVELTRRVGELGVDFIDTASVYGAPHGAEAIIREALHPYPEHLLITTKGGQVQYGPAEYATLGRPEFLRYECAMSLRSLGVDHIDLYQLHQVDPKVPFEEQIGALIELKDEGKIGAIGLNEVTLDQIVAARKMTEIASVQNQYSLTERKHQDVLDYCTREGLPFISWWPLDMGALTKPDGPLKDIAMRVDATTAQVALAWLLARAENLAMIPGTTSIAHLEENVAAGAVRLGAEELAELDALAG